MTDPIDKEAEAAKLHDINEAWLEYQTERIAERVGRPLETHQVAFVTGFLMGARSAAPVAPRMRELSDKFEPQSEQPKTCANCGQPYHEHYSGPFSKPGEMHCSKYGVPREVAPSEPKPEAVRPTHAELIAPIRKALIDDSYSEHDEAMQALSELERRLNRG